MQSKYKAEWKPFSLNKKFWNEVLKGRTIQSLEWDDEGLSALVLDDGQRVTLVMGGTAGSTPTLAINY